MTKEELQAKINDFQKRSTNKSLPDSAKRVLLQKIVELKKQLSEMDSKDEPKEDKPKKDKPKETKKESTKKDTPNEEPDCDELLDKYRKQKRDRKKRQKEQKADRRTEATKVKDKVEDFADSLIKQMEELVDKNKIDANKLEKIIEALNTVLTKLKKVKKEV